ncbi:MAG TPA: hypothetical protein VG269_11440 [Tepidisphaeraceae bacterium]|jgi:hypothetical protein|nr:hypothetical protein [Tepidisphaeraceae bacterium]
MASGTTKRQAAKPKAKSHRRPVGRVAKRVQPRLTKAEIDRLIAQSPAEEWNANDDVDVFKPAKP